MHFYHISLSAIQFKPLKLWSTEDVAHFVEHGGPRAVTVPALKPVADAVRLPVEHFVHSHMSEFPHKQRVVSLCSG